MNGRRVLRAAVFAGLIASGSATVLAQAPVESAGAERPVDDRSMAFTAGGGPECRESVPGGPVLAIAYAVVIGLMGGYVALLARRNARLSLAIDRLEGDLAKHRGPVDETHEAPGT